MWNLNAFHRRDTYSGASEAAAAVNSLEFQIPDHPKREGPTNYTMFENHQEMSQGKNYYLIFDEYCTGNCS